MPDCESRYFGRLEWEPDAELMFPCGLPGFEQERRFIAVRRPQLEPFVFLQSAASPGVCFLTLPVGVVDRDYQPAVSPEDLKLLALPEDRQPVLGAEALCLAIVSLREHEPPSANLLAPVVVNLETRLAVQAIRGDTRYSHRDPLPACEVETCS